MRANAGTCSSDWRGLSKPTEGTRPTSMRPQPALSAERALGPLGLENAAW